MKVHLCTETCREMQQSHLSNINASKSAANLKKPFSVSFFYFSFNLLSQQSNAIKPFLRPVFFTAIYFTHLRECVLNTRQTVPG